MVMLLWGGAHAVPRGELSFGQVVQCLFYVQLFLGPLQELSDLLERYTSGAASAQRIFLLLDTEPEVADPALPQALDRVRGDIHFDRVDFAYAPQRPVINGLDLRIAPGEVLAIVGPPGTRQEHAGAAADPLLRHRGRRGRLDGVDIRALSQRQLRRHVGVVLRGETCCSRGTILDNLRLGPAPEADDEHLIAAARELGADAVLERLPLGYRTPVGAMGGQLSRGGAAAGLSGGGPSGRSCGAGDGRGDPPPSTCRPSVASRPRYGGSARAAPRSSSPTAWRRSAMPTASRSSSRDASSSSVRTMR
ncbi:putative ABC transporter ATP-binding protein YknV [Ditylenchus destructor]|nr:putative ABC transporter ATP-binding protein YknV [Ditylenchus destructor]